MARYMPKRTGICTSIGRQEAKGETLCLRWRAWVSSIIF